MTILTALIIVATLATIATLVMGLWTMVYGSDDADADAEFQLLLGGMPALVAADFTL